MSVQKNNNITCSFIEETIQQQVIQQVILDLFPCEMVNYAISIVILKARYTLNCVSTDMAE